MKNKFNKKKKYKNTCMIFSPNGIVKEGTVLNGAEWRDVLVFEVGENSFNTMFKLVK